MKRYRTILIGILIILIQGSSAKGFNISTFDPVGQQLNRLEEVIPGLELKGFFLNRTDIDLHGPTGHPWGHLDRLGNTREPLNKDWNFQLIEWDGELELRYRISSNLELINIDHLLYDAIYDWDGSANLPKRAEREEEDYHTFRRIMSELYLKAIHKNWFFQLGKQQIIWGRMDGKCIDVINPEDARESAQYDQDDYNWRRIPTWMANISYFWSDYSFQILWIPDFEPSVGPRRDTVWWYGGLPAVPALINPVISKVDKPSAAFRNHEFALRFSMLKRLWDISFIYFNTWDDRPTYFRRGYRVDPRTGVTDIYIEPEHTRLHQFGAYADKSLWFLGREWAFRLESLYTLNHYENTDAEPVWNDGVTKKNNLLTFLSLESNWWHGEITVLFQPMWRYQFGYDGQLRILGRKIKKSDTSFAFSLTKKWFFDRLSLNLTFYYQADQGDWKFKDTISFALSDYLLAQIRFTGYAGNSDDPMGMYNDWDNIGWELKYSF